MADVVENFKNAVLTEAVMNRGPGIDLVDAFAKSVMFHQLLGRTRALMRSQCKLCAI
jgi:hypothetical protein